MFKTKTEAPQPVPPPMRAAPPKPQAPRQPPKSNVPTIISTDMVIEGNLKSEGDLQVEGTITGEIEIGHLVIADGGTVHGNITAQTVRVCGTLHGNISANMVTLTSTARVVGDVNHDLLAIETGGMLEGHSHRRAGVPAVADPVARQQILMNAPDAEPLSLDEKFDAEREPAGFHRSSI